MSRALGQLFPPKGAAWRGLMQSKVHIREAFRGRHHPQWLEARERVRSGVICDPPFMQVAFSYLNDDPSNIRNRADQGGGSPDHIGSYAMVAGRWFFKAEARRVIATIDRHLDFGTDRCTGGLLDFGAGRQPAFSVSTQAASYQRVAGSRDRLQIPVPSRPQDRSCRFAIDDGGAPDGSNQVEIVLDVADQYQHQAEAFSRACA